MTPFAIDALRSEPWRNGAGWTRTVCARELDGQTLWRISVADITAASRFSQFEGMDRTAVMVQGGRLRLSNAEVQLDFDGMGSQIAFPGEWALDCSAPEVPTQLLNTMVRRGAATARVQVLCNTTLTLVPDVQQVLLVLRGQYRLQSPSGTSHTLPARHGMRWQGRNDEWKAQPLGAEAMMVCCTILQ